MCVCVCVCVRVRACVWRFGGRGWSPLGLEYSFYDNLVNFTCFLLNKYHDNAEMAGCDAIVC